MTDELLQYLPADLQQVRYKGAHESAWAAQAALQVIAHLSAHEVAVLGGEVWLPTNPGPTIPGPFIYTWSIDEKRDNESWSQFVQRANQLAKTYVSTFRWDDADVMHQSRTPYFNFTFATAQEYEEL
jgi:hypothetical protein